MGTGGIVGSSKDVTFIKARMATISSTALPSVAFNSPPSVSPILSAASSVAKPSRPATGSAFACLANPPTVITSVIRTKRHDRDKGGDKDGRVRDRPVPSVLDKVQRPPDGDKHQENVAILFSSTPTRTSAVIRSGQGLTHIHELSTAALKLAKKEGALPTFRSGVNRPVVMRFSTPGPGLAPDGSVLALRASWAES